MTGPVVRTLTGVAALILVGWGRALAQDAPAASLSLEAEQAHEIAPVVLDGEVLFRVRGFSGYLASQRARVIAERILAASADPRAPARVEIAASAEGLRLAAGDHFLMTVVDGDARLEDLKTESLAAVLARRIEEAITAYREARSPAVVLRAVQRAAAATLGLLVAIALAVVGPSAPRSARRARVREPHPLRPDPVLRDREGAAPAGPAARP